MSFSPRIKCVPKSIPALRVIRLKSNNGAPFSTNVMKNDNRIKCGPKSILALRVICLKSNNGAAFSTNVLTFRREDTVHRFQ